MNMKKTALAAALAATMGTATTASADIIEISFTGLFSLGDSAGVIQLNADATEQANFGFRTDVTGTATFDTDTGAGSATIAGFSFFGGGLAEATDVLFQAIGDGAGGPGTLVAGQMGFNWNGNNGIPVTAIFDASGFFASIGAVGTTWTVDANSAGNATSSTGDYVITSPFGTFTGVLGTAPMAMTNFNTAGTTLGSIFPLTDDGISGSPMTTAPFLGFNANFDFMSMTATNLGNPVTGVPVPAAVWLFGSGLVGLAGVARRRRS